MGVLFFVGIAIVFGFLGGKLSNFFKLPSVVGYLIAGLILGSSVLKIFSLELLDDIGVFNDVALGLVAFIIGSELRLSVLKKMGKGIVTIIFAESFAAFIIVFLGVYFLTHKVHVALIFGAMAPASAPAGTAIVLQEYKAKGPLTNALYAVVGLDDGLAIMIYAFAAALAKIYLLGSEVSFATMVKGPILEIVGAIILGVIIGAIFGYFIRKLHRKNDVLAISIGAVLICSGLSSFFNVSIILSNLSLGMIFANIFLLANRRAYKAINSVITPIYIIFFVIAGAHLQIRLLPTMGLLGLIYIVSRTSGLMGGAFVGAAVSNQNPVIKKYLGFGILSQAGVAIGLAILATREFGALGDEGQHLALLVINTIAATTIVFEIIGPIATKFAISRAGEIGKAK